MKEALRARDQLKKQADDMKDLADKRFFWIVVLTDLRTVMMQAEAAEKASLTTPENGGTNTDAGVWVDTFTPVMPDNYGAGTQAASIPGGMGRASGGYGGRGGRYERYRGESRPPPTAPTAPTPGAAATSTFNEVTSLKLLCRGINRPGPSANSDLAYSVRQFLTNSPSFTNANLVGNISPGDDTNTFTFEMSVDLRHHFKL
jgi:hypothetical protein